MNKNEYHIDTLVLEINEEKGIVGEYQRVLYEASLMGIDRVSLACVWKDDADEKRSRGEDIFPKIVKTCELLKIEPLAFQVGYYNNMYDGPMIGKTNSKGTIESFNCNKLISFEEYKEGKGTLLEKRDSVGKVLAKHITEWYK